MEKGMELINIMKSRRSIRAYKPDIPVTKEQIRIILDAAMHAPSACNTRPWEFIAITDRDMLNRIADAHEYAQMVRTAPLAIIVCALPDTQSGIAMNFWPQDCGAVTENILIAAQALGLGSCWCGVCPNEARMATMRGILGIPQNVLPFNVIAIGTPNENPPARGGYDDNKVRVIE